MVSRSEKETEEIGKTIGMKLKNGDVVALYGELGSGKTVLVRGIARGVGCEELVKSPSFVFVHEYKGRIPVYHIDLYRVNELKDVMSLGIGEFFGSGVCVVEWAEKAEGLLPADCISVELKIIGEYTREIVEYSKGTLISR